MLKSVLTCMELISLDSISFLALYAPTTFHDFLLPQMKKTQKNESVSRKFHVMEDLA